MLATVLSSCLLGVEAHAVTVEAQIGRGLPGFDVVGLPDRYGRESRVRVKAALDALGFTLPPKHIVLNLAPSDLRKAGSGFDLAMALAVLAACDAAPSAPLAGTLVLGELSLAGALRPVAGVLAHLRAARARGLRRAIIPAANEADAGLASGIEVRVAATLDEVVAWMHERAVLREAAPRLDVGEDTSGEDLADLRGQATARRALEIAAAGEHPVLLVGPPGSGKTMLARRLRTILPPATPDEVLEIATLAGTACTTGSLARVGRPFRAPHHTASAAAIVGGGDPIRPGEVTLAHGGVLFLDELPEFRRDAIETLRTTMEHGVVVIARSHGRVSMPARPLVIAAMNPCPCGYAGDSKRLCSCPPDRVLRYRGRISGPLLDRFDLHVTVPRIDPRALRGETRSETSADVRDRVIVARARLAEQGACPPATELARALPADAVARLDLAVERLGLSARAHAKVLRVARTIAALEGTDHITTACLAEALQYRGPERAETNEHSAVSAGHGG